MYSRLSRFQLTHHDTSRPQHAEKSSHPVFTRQQTPPPTNTARRHEHTVYSLDNIQIPVLSSDTMQSLPLVSKSVCGSGAYANSSVLLTQVRGPQLMTLLLPLPASEMAAHRTMTLQSRYVQVREVLSKYSSVGQVSSPLTQHPKKSTQK